MAYVMALQQGWPTDNLSFKGTFTLPSIYDISR